MQGLYTYISHVFDFWKLEFENEKSTLFFIGRASGGPWGPQVEREAKLRNATRKGWKFFGHSRFLGGTDKMQNI